MSLSKNFSWMATGRAIYVASQWLLLVVIARLTSPEALGEFTYALAVTGPIIIFAQLNMRAFMATDAREQFQFRDYLATRLFGVTLALLIVSIVAIGSNLSSHATILLILVGLYKAVEAVSDIFFGILQKREAMSNIALSFAARGITAVFAMTLLLVATGNKVIGAVGIVVLWVAILLIYDIPAAKKWLVPSNYAGMPRILDVVKACFPMGLILVFISLRVNIPVYFVKADLGADQVGYYSAVAYFLVAGGLITGSLSQTASPRLARYYHQGESAKFLNLFIKLIFIVTLVGLSGVLISYTIGDVILTVFYGSSYGKFADLFVWIMVAACIGYISQLLGMSLTVARLLRYQLLSNGLGVLAILALSFYLIPSYGITGGAFALVGGSATTLFCNALLAIIKLDLNRGGTMAAPGQDTNVETSKDSTN